MSKVNLLKQQVQKLSVEELAEFRIWFRRYDWELWDQQIERDARAQELVEHDKSTESVDEWSENLIQQGRAKGLEQSLAGRRHILVRQTRIRFGEDCAEILAGYLEQVNDDEQLIHIGESLVVSTNQGTFLDHVKTLIECS